jgi:hypothetical protein
MSSSDTFYINERVLSPNGIGVVWGWIQDEGKRMILVHHILKDMTRRDKGLCWTPNAAVSTLYAYPPDDLMPLSTLVFEGGKK